LEVSTVIVFEVVVLGTATMFLEVVHTARKGEERTSAGFFGRYM
jgi:hypothetical protein